MNGPITESQKEYIQDLLTKRQVDPDVMADIAQHLESPACSKRTASEFIALLRQLPRKRTKDDAVFDEFSKVVPEGRYAVYDTADDNTLKFYIVDRPTEGKWAGYVFVKVKAGPEAYNLSISESKRVLALIAEDPKIALLRYGQELGHCGHCGRELTNASSRRIGIGPVCRARDGAKWGL